MKIGVAIATFNEGPDLEVTIAMALASLQAPHCVCVYNDASTTPLRRSTLQSGASIFSGTTQQGSGYAKSQAIKMCIERGAEAVVVLDSHMRMPYDWLNKIDAALSEHRSAVGCPTCRGFESASTFIGAGASFGKHLLGPEPVWAPRGKEPIEVIPCVLGACYFATAETWIALGFFNENFYGWGGEEQDISLKAWMSGRKVIRLNDLVVQHRFDRANTGFFLNSWHAQYNAMALCATLFEPGIFETLYEPFMRASFAPEAIKHFDILHESILATRAAWRSKVVVSDAEIAVWTHPTTAEQSAKLEKPKPAPRVGTTGRHPAVTDHIGASHREQILKHAADDKRILEWGAGGSTLYFRENGIDTFTIEHAILWAARVGGRVYVIKVATDIGGPHEETIDGAEVKSHPYASFAETLGQFSTILVDGILRNCCLEVAAKMLKPGGAVFLHDSQRDWYKRGMALFNWEDLGEDPTYPGARMAKGTLKC